VVINKIFESIGVISTYKLIVLSRSTGTMHIQSCSVSLNCTSPDLRRECYHFGPEHKRRSNTRHVQCRYDAGHELNFHCATNTTRSRKQQHLPISGQTVTHPKHTNKKVLQCSELRMDHSQRKYWYWVCLYFVSTNFNYTTMTHFKLPMQYHTRFIRTLAMLLAIKFLLEPNFRTGLVPYCRPQTSSQPPNNGSYEQGFYQLHR
jgi:hypothetical protein